MDTNAVGSSNTGASAEKIAAIAEYERSELFSPAEKAALRLAEAMSQTPAVVSDELFAATREHFSEPQLVELVATAAMENYRARFNRAFGVESQGFYHARLTSTS
jgi:alkylhydroperoxidase family enzyme